MIPVLAHGSVRALLRQGVEKLRLSGVPSYALAAELLLLSLAAKDRTWLYSHPDEILPDPLADAYFALLARRARGIPTQHLTGKQEFWGLEFAVTPEVLIPRPETEQLIEVALERLAAEELRAGREPHLKERNVRLVDVGTGSGCIAIALAKELPAATVYATDISKAALRVADQNAARHGLSSRIHFFQSHLLDAVSARVRAEAIPPFDLIISNPPYIGLRERESLPIDVREHEPRLALFGGEEGYELYGQLISGALPVLKPAGLLVVELGHNSLPAVEPLLDRAEWTEVAVANDLAGIRRVLSAERTAVPADRLQS